MKPALTTAARVFSQNRDNITEVEAQRNSLLIQTYFQTAKKGSKAIFLTHVATGTTIKIYRDVLGRFCFCLYLKEWTLYSTGAANLHALKLQLFGYQPHTGNYCNYSLWLTDLIFNNQPVNEFYY